MVRSRSWYPALARKRSPLKSTLVVHRGARAPPVLHDMRQVRGHDHVLGRVIAEVFLAMELQVVVTVMTYWMSFACNLHEPALRHGIDNSGTLAS